MIEDGQVTIENAIVIVDVNGEGSSATIQDRTQAVGDGLDDDVEIGNPAGLTTTPLKSLENLGKPSSRRSQERRVYRDVYPKRLPNDDAKVGSSLGNHSGKDRFRVYRKCHVVAKATTSTPNFTFEISSKRASTR